MRSLAWELGGYSPPSPGNRTPERIITSLRLLQLQDGQSWLAAWLPSEGDQTGLAQRQESLACGSLLQAGSPSDLGHAPARFVKIPAPEESSGHRHDEAGAREPRGQSDPGKRDRTPDEWLSIRRPGRELASLNLAIERGREAKILNVEILEALTHWSLTPGSLVTGIYRNIKYQKGQGGMN
jgi:hypothetical protein